MFAKPGEHALNDVGVLPKSQIYVVHPALDEVIGSLSPAYFSALDRRNIVGPGMDWKTHRDISFVLKGDLKGFSEIMREPNASAKFQRQLKDVLALYCGKLAFYQNEGGDSLLLIHDNPFEIAEAAFGVAAEINRDWGKSFRVVLDWAILAYHSRPVKFICGLNNDRVPTGGRTSGTLLRAERVVCRLA